MKSIIRVLDKIKETVPVEWDRFTVDDDDYHVVYGWIPRGDGQRDFVLVSAYGDHSLDNLSVTTSSAKYSKTISLALCGSTEGHSPCRKIEELYQADSPTKGSKGGECNRTACQNQNALWFNHSTKRYYCPNCANMINFYNRVDALRLFGHDLCTLESDSTK